MAPSNKTILESNRSTNFFLIEAGLFIYLLKFKKIFIKKVGAKNFDFILEKLRFSNLFFIAAIGSTRDYKRFYRLCAILQI